MSGVRLALAAAAALGALLAAPAGASADSCEYTGIGAWETDVNWSCSSGVAHVPAAGDVAIIGSGDAVTVSASAAVDALTLDADGQLVFAAAAVLTVSASLGVNSGTLTGDGAVSTAPAAAFMKSTAGALTVKNGADLVLGGSAALAGGNVCLTDDAGQDPTLLIGGLFTIESGADATPFPCSAGLDGPAIVVGPGGQLVKAAGSTGTSVFATKLRIAGGTLQLSAGQGMTSAGIEQSSGLTSIAVGAIVDGGAPATIDGGTFSVDGSFTGTPTLAGGALNVGGTVSGNATVSGGAMSVAGTLTGNAEVSGGALSVGGTLSGNATLTGGTLNVAGILTGATTLTGGAVLTGAGTLAGPVTVSAGTIRPGSSPGKLTVDGPLTLGAGSTLEVDVDSPIRETGYDYLHVLGAATLDGTLKVVQGAGYPEPLVIDIFTFLDSASRSGTFAALDAPSLPNGKRYRLDYPASASFGARLALVQSPQNTAAPTADGATSAGSLLSCSTGTWAGTPAPSFSIEWLRDGQPVPGATQSSYSIGDADAQHALACRVTAVNEVGSTLATSGARDIAPVAPELMAAPRVAGGDRPGSVLSCQTGSWSGFPAPALSVEWLLDGQPAAGDGAQYTIGPQDAGHSIACRVTASNGAGSKDAISSALAAAKSAEQLLSESPESTVAGKIGMPSSRACLKERYLRLRVRQPSGVRINAVTVLGNGKKNKANKTAGRFNTSFDLHHISKKTLTVRITITTASGLKSVAERRYRICLPKRKSARRR